MADVFVSYATEDRERVAPIVEAIEHADPTAATLADAWVLCRSTIEHPGSCDPSRI